MTPDERARDPKRHQDPERQPTRLERRLARIRAEVERNRRGEAAIPTWALAVTLVVLVGGLTLLVVLS
jgi:hypothetical protein